MSIYTIEKKVKNIILNLYTFDRKNHSSYFNYYIQNNFLKNRKNSYEYIEIIRNDFLEYNQEKNFKKKKNEYQAKQSEQVKYLVYKDFEKSSSNNFVQSSFSFFGNNKDNCEIYLFKYTFTSACRTVDDVINKLQNNKENLIGSTHQKIIFNNSFHISLDLETNVVIKSKKKEIDSNKNEEPSTEPFDDNISESSGESNQNGNEIPDDDGDDDNYTTKWKKKFNIYFFVIIVNGEVNAVSDFFSLRSEKQFTRRKDSILKKQYKLLKDNKTNNYEYYSNIFFKPYNKRINTIKFKPEFHFKINFYHLSLKLSNDSNSIRKNSLNYNKCSFKQEATTSKSIWYDDDDSLSENTVSTSKNIISAYRNTENSLNERNDSNHKNSLNERNDSNHENNLNERNDFNNNENNLNERNDSNHENSLNERNDSNHEISLNERNDSNNENNLNDKNDSNYKLTNNMVSKYNGNTPCYDSSDIYFSKNNDKNDNDNQNVTLNSNSVENNNMTSTSINESNICQCCKRRILIKGENECSSNDYVPSNYYSNNKCKSTKEDTNNNHFDNSISIYGNTNTIPMNYGVKWENKNNNDSSS
ncbi:hypothetical protein PIROE2DRAFT_6670, partial [Piromyces sp. E2]